MDGFDAYWQQLNEICSTLDPSAKGMVLQFARDLVAYTEHDSAPVETGSQADQEARARRELAWLRVAEVGESVQ
jgi:hypothetical protein